MQVTRGQYQGKPYYQFGPNGTKFYYTPKDFDSRALAKAKAEAHKANYESGYTLNLTS